MRRSIMFALTAIALSGCMTLPRYKNIEPSYSGSSSGTGLTAPAVIFLEPVVVGKRFDEVVCDNVVGAIWNPEESTQIGFTQNYAEVLPKILPLIALEATLGRNIGVGAVGGKVAAGESSLNFDKIKIDSRIMVPFGSYISRNVEQMLGVTNSESTVCFDSACIEKQRHLSSSKAIATVRFTKFRVAEDKPNKLTLVAEGVVLVEQQGRNREAPVRYEVVDRSISSEGYTHSSFLRVMDKTANELASALAEQILRAVQ